MKRNFRILLVTAYLIAAPLIMFAQSPPNPNGGSNPGSGNLPVGSTGGENNTPTGAPVGNGIYAMLAMGIAYGAFKLYTLRSNTVTE